MAFLVCYVFISQQEFLFFTLVSARVIPAIVRTRAPTRKVFFNIGLLPTFRHDGEDRLKLRIGIKKLVYLV